MAVVDYAYYTGVYLGDSVTTADFPRYEKRAEAIIESLTRGAYSDTLPADVQTAYKAAICYQVDYLADVGLSAAVTGSVARSYSIGKVRVENGASASVKRGMEMVSPAAISILEMTGLLSRKLPVKGAWAW